MICFPALDKGFFFNCAQHFNLERKEVRISVKNLDHICSVVTVLLDKNMFQGNCTLNDLL